MEAVEDEQRQRDSGNDAPRQKAVEGELQFLGQPVVRHKRVQQPQSDVGEEQESDDLTTRLEEHLVTRRANTFAGFCDKHALQGGLNE